MHYNHIGKNCQRISNIKRYTELYDLSGIKFPTPSNQWKKFESQNPDVALNVLYVEGNCYVVLHREIMVIFIVEIALVVFERRTHARITLKGAKIMIFVT